MNDDVSSESASAEPDRALVPRMISAGIVGAEGIALALYTLVLGFASLSSSGATESAPIVMLMIYLIFAVGLVLVSRGLLIDSTMARAPYFLAQIFVIITGVTLDAGDGGVVKTVGIAVIALGVVGLVTGVWTIIKSPDIEPRTADVREKKPSWKDASPKAAARRAAQATAKPGDND